MLYQKNNFGVSILGFVIDLELRQYKNGLFSVKNMFVLKLPPFIPNLHGNFKASMRFTETNPFLYCLSSKLLALLSHEVKGNK